MGWAAIAQLLPAAIQGASALWGPKEKQPKIKDYHPYTRDQEDIIERIQELVGPLNENAMSYLNQILSNDPEAFAEFEAPMKQAYEQETIPNILERFSSVGARNSSALNQTLARSGRDLSMDLAAQRANLRDSALGRLGQFNQTALTRTKEPYIKGGAPGGASAAAPFAGAGVEGIIDFLKSLNKGGAASGGTGGTGSVGGNTGMSAFYGG